MHTLYVVYLYSILETRWRASFNSCNRPKEQAKADKVFVVNQERSCSTTQGEPVHHRCDPSVGLGCQA